MGCIFYYDVPVEIPDSLSSGIMVTALALGVGVCAFNTSWVIPKTLKMVSVATLLAAQHLTGFSSPKTTTSVIGIQ